MSAPAEPGQPISFAERKKAVAHLVGRPLVPFFDPDASGDEQLIENTQQRLVVDKDFSLQPGQTITVREWNPDGYFSTPEHVGDGGAAAGTTASYGGARTAASAPPAAKQRRKGGANSEQADELSQLLQQVHSAHAGDAFANLMDAFAQPVTGVSQAREAPPTSAAGGAPASAKKASTKRKNAPTPAPAPAAVAPSSAVKKGNKKAAGTSSSKPNQPMTLDASKFADFATSPAPDKIPMPRFQATSSPAPRPSAVAIHAVAAPAAASSYGSYAAPFYSPAPSPTAPSPTTVRNQLSSIAPLAFPPAPAPAPVPLPAPAPLAAPSTYGLPAPTSFTNPLTGLTCVSIPLSAHSPARLHLLQRSTAPLPAHVATPISASASLAATASTPVSSGASYFVSPPSSSSSTRSANPPVVQLQQQPFAQQEGRQAEAALSLPGLSMGNWMNEQQMTSSLRQLLSIGGSGSS